MPLRPALDSLYSMPQTILFIPPLGPAVSRLFPRPLAGCDNVDPTSMTYVCLISAVVVIEIDA